MKRLCVIFLLIAAGSRVWASSDKPVAHINVAGRDVAMWKPAGATPTSGFPVILFSHGFGGCNTQSVFLMEALASAGYFVLAPNHQDSRCRNSGGTQKSWHPGKLREGMKRPEEPFRDESAWTDQTYKDRKADMRAVLNAVTRTMTFEGLNVDRNRIGVAGHSLGGYTALGLGGGWKSWKDPRIKAVLALSPYCSPYAAKGSLETMGVPVMYQGGTRDLGVTPTVRRVNGAYDHSSAPKYYVEFDGAGHLAWTDIVKSYQEMIDSYSISFFNLYLKNKAVNDVDLSSTTKPKGVSFLRVDLKN